MSESIEFILQNRKLIIASFSRHWKARRYLEALNWLVQTKDPLVQLSICGEILQLPSDILSTICSNCEHSILFCQLAAILIQQKKDTYKEVGIQVLEMLSTYSFVSSNHSSNDLMQYVKYHFVSVIKNVSTPLSSNEELCQRFERVLAFSNLLEM